MMKFEEDRIKQIELSHKIVAKAIEDLYGIYRTYEANEMSSKKVLFNNQNLKELIRNQLFTGDEFSRPRVIIMLIEIAQRLKRARELTFLNGEFSRPKKEKSEKK